MADQATCGGPTTFPSPAAAPGEAAVSVGGGVGDGLAQEATTTTAIAARLRTLRTLRKGFVRIGIVAPFGSGIVLPIDGRLYMTP
jgi:hypothetical protein